MNLFVNLMNHTSKKVIFDEEIIDMVEKETMVYFKGDKSLDETVEIIQQQVTAYVKERH